MLYRFVLDGNMALNKKASVSLKSRKATKAHEEVVAEKSHSNFMAGPSYKVGDPINLLRTAAASCFFGEPQYYRKDMKPSITGRPPASQWATTDSDYKHLDKVLGHRGREEWRGLDPTAVMELSIDQALDFDVEATLKLAVELRTVHHIRVTPQVIMVRAANHKNAKGTGLVRKYAKQIMQRADEPSTQLAYQIHRFGRKSIPNSLKRAWREVLAGYSDYELAKYRMDGREVKTVDVVNLCHPKSDGCSKLSKGELVTTGDTWEAIISEKGSNKAAWIKAIEKMGHMALLRNLRNLTQAGVNYVDFVGKLLHTAKTGQQLPFRYYSAYKQLKNESGMPSAVLDAVEECLELAITNNLPHFSGKVISLSDNSGSAHGAITSSAGSTTVAEIDNLMALITAKASDQGYVGIFGDRLQTYEIRKKTSIFDDLKIANEIGQGIGGGTENGIWLFWDRAIQKKEHWDHVFVYSDMQAGHGGLYGENPAQYAKYMYPGKGRDSRYIDVPKLIQAYREKVNPNVMVYLVQTAGYTDTIIPEFYDRTFILGGWSDAILKFADEMNRQYGVTQQ